MAQKTIIIGMGSQGYQACNQVARRIEGTFQGLDRIPWVKMLVFETESAIGTTHLADLGMAKNIGIRSDVFAAITTKPQQFEHAIDLPTWADVPALAAGGAPINGANNRRMTGRLCWLEASNFAVFDSLFRKAYHELSQLTSSEATQARGKLSDGTNPAVEFAKIGAEDAQSIRVFVIGSLTGGTNSGSFVDIGYYLKTLDGISPNLNTIGIFSVPHSSYQEKVHWGNAYAGLTELNHYHVVGKTYSAKYANREARVESNIPPFDLKFVIQPRGGGDRKVEIGQMVHALSEVLHLSAMNDSGNAIEATLVNALGNYGSERDLDGRPMPYCTFGASAVVFPVTHIVDGCAARLVDETLSEILENRAFPEAEAEGVMNKLAVTSESYQQRILNHPQVESYLQDLGRQASQACDAALKGDKNALSNIDVTVRDNIATAFHSRSQNYQGEFRGSIADVSRALATERVEQLGREVAQMLKSRSHGVIWTEQMLAKLETALAERSAQLKSPDTSVDVWLAAQSSGDRSKMLEQELVNGKSGCMPFGKKKKKDELAFEWKKATQDHWKASLVVSSGEVEREVLDEMLEVVRRFRKRISDPHNGFRAFLEGVRDRQRENAASANREAPIVNGLCLFEPNTTIPAAYSQYLPRESDAALARADLLSSLDPWFAEISKPRDLSAHDRPRKAEAHDLEESLFLARRPFTALHEETVERRLVAWPNWELELKRVAQAGRILLDLAVERNQHGVPPDPNALRRPATAYFHAAGASDRTSDAGRVATALAAGAYPVQGFQEKHRILFTEGLAIFSLYSISGVPTNQENYSDDRRSRRDVAWQHLDGSPLTEQEDYYVGLLLTGLALAVVEYRPNGPFAFQTLATPFNRSRAYPIDRDLADAAYHLDRKPLEAEDLTTRIRELIQGDIDGVAKKIKTFNTQAEELNFSIQNMRVDNQIAFERLIPFARTVPGLLAAILALFDNYRPPTIASFYNNGDLGGGKQVEPAYRCDRCGQFLAPYSAGATLDLIPDRCVGCGKNLRLDKLFGEKV